MRVVGFQMVSSPRNTPGLCSWTPLGTRVTQTPTCYCLPVIECLKTSLIGDATPGK